MRLLLALVTALAISAAALAQPGVGFERPGPGQGRPGRRPAPEPDASAPVTSEPVTLTFPAAQGRLNTGLFVRRGDRLDIAARGSWTMWGGHWRPAGPTGHLYRVGPYGWGNLMARVGSGPEISIGTNASWPSPSTGLLVLYPNTGEMGLREPQGELTVTVRGARRLEDEIARLAERGARVTVPADRDQVITTLYVPSGREVQIDAFGEWQMHEGGPWLPPDGAERRVGPDGIRWGQLMARFGGPTFTAEPTYRVGSQAVLRPRRGGLLELHAYTGDFAGHTRSGSVEVVVRGAVPATPELVERALRETTDYERERGFLRVHQLRRLAGLGGATSSPELMRAAQAHAEYLAANTREREGEEPGRPGFTGATPAERAAAAGFRGTVVGEAVHGYTDALAAVDGLWAAVYHRLPLIDPVATAVGVGVAAGRDSAFVVLTGVPEVPDPELKAPPEMVLFPADKQRDVAPAWNGLEDPDPLPADAARPLGYPLSITLAGPAMERVTAARLTDLSGRPVAVQVLDPVTDPHQRLTSSAFLVPATPLASLMTYRAHVELATASGPRIVDWLFTTGTGGTLMLAPPSPVDPAKPPVDLGRQPDGPG